MLQVKDFKMEQKIPNAKEKESKMLSCRRSRFQGHTNVIPLPQTYPHMSHTSIKNLHCFY